MINILKVEWIIFLERDEDRCEEIFGHVQNLLAHERKEVEHRVITTITHTGKVVGCCEHGFHTGTAKDTKGI